MAGTCSLPACPSPEGLAPCQDFLCALLWPVCSMLLIGLCVTWGFLAGFAETCCLGALCLSKPWCCPPHGFVGPRGWVGFSVGAGLPEVGAIPAASSRGSETESCAPGLGQTSHREDFVSAPQAPALQQASPRLPTQPWTKDAEMGRTSPVGPSSSALASTQTHGHMVTKIHRYTLTDTRTHGLTHLHTHRLSHTDTQTHRHTDSRTHRHMDSCTHTLTHT